MQKRILIPLAILSPARSASYVTLLFNVKKLNQSMYSKQAHSRGYNKTLVVQPFSFNDPSTYNVNCCLRSIKSQFEDKVYNHLNFQSYSGLKINVLIT